MPAPAVGPATYHADGDLWHVAAIHVAVRGRQARREAIEAAGPTEIVALDALAALVARWLTAGPDLSRTPYDAPS